MNTIRGVDESLERAILSAFDGLLRALDIEPLGDDRFRAVGEPSRFDQVFGGQVVAQSWLAASATVADKDPHSLHAYFVQGGVSEQPVELAVHRVRDGRSMATRRVTVTQDGRTLLVVLCSFHANPTCPELAKPIPPVAAPEELPLVQDWVPFAPPELAANARNWVDRPPPLEVRIGEPPYFLGGSSALGSRAHWMRLPRNVGDNPLRHSALLAYASDYFLLDMAFRSHPETIPASSIIGLSLDHSLWLHRPVRFDQWHLHTQQTLAFSGYRGLVWGAIHNAAGHLVASVTQEVLVRAAR